MTRAARVLGLVIAALATSATAQKVEKTCQIITTKSTCKLECVAKSFSQTCDEPYNTCRSTCGLYDEQNTPAVADLLHALVLRTNASDPPLEKRLSLAEPAAITILNALQEQILNGAPPGTYVVILLAPKDNAFKFKLVNQLKGEIVPADKDQMIIIFLLDPRTYAALKAKDPSIDAMVQQARDIILKTILR